MAACLSLLPPLFASDGSGVVPIQVHGHGNAAAPIPAPGRDGGTPTQRNRLVPSSPSMKASATNRLRVSKRSRVVTKRWRVRVPGLAGSDEEPIIDGLLLVPPFPWATTRVCTHHSLAELSRRGIDSISGEAQCKRCDDTEHVVFDVESKFKELYDFISSNIQTMDDRAPQSWLTPDLPDCGRCGQKNSMRPVIPRDKAKINWVFLLLGQTLGLCALEQLKFFCAHTSQHRTGAKDRVLYSTYLELCNQLLPDGPFDMALERMKRNIFHA